MFSELFIKIWHIKLNNTVKFSQAKARYITFQKYAGVFKN